MSSSTSTSTPIDAPFTQSRGGRGGRGSRGGRGRGPPRGDDGGNASYRTYGIPRAQGVPDPNASVVPITSQGMFLGEPGSLRRQNYRETEDAYVLDVDVGDRKADEVVLQVLLHQRMLTLNGSDEEEGTERPRLARRWRLPLTADTEAISAKIVGSVLSVVFK